MSPVAVRRYPFVMRRLLLVVARFPERTADSRVSVFTAPDRLTTVFEIVFSDPERSANADSAVRIRHESVEIVPESAFCARESVKYRLVPSDISLVLPLHPNTQVRLL
jgi:hypothetical protein